MTQNLEEYQDPTEYDQENSSYGPSGPFYEALANQYGGPVLELGCGTGRVTIPMAQAGLTMTGLDITPGMIERARAKSEGLPIRWEVGDCTRFELGQTYGMVFVTGHSFQALLTREAIEATLRCVHNHLSDGGIFAFETRNPNVGHLMEDQTEEEWFTYVDPAGRTVRVSGWQEYDAYRQVQRWVTNRRYTEPDGVESVKTTTIDLRYTFPQELEALLHYNGFEVMERYGWFDKSPITAQSRELIYVARKAGHSISLFGR